MSNLSHWSRMFMEHAFYLLPLCVNTALKHHLEAMPALLKLLMLPLPTPLQRIYTFAYILTPFVVLSFGGYCIDTNNSFCFFPGSPHYCRVRQCNVITNDENCRKKDIEIVREWTMDQKPSNACSSHWWFHELPKKQKDAFARVADSPVIFNAFRSIFSDRHYHVEVVEGMNEIYVSSPTREGEATNSDHVFYSRHVDGPWAFVPYVSVYRCIVGMDRNLMITTHYPIANLSHNACKGDAIIFDYNREIHYITSDPAKRAISDDFRVVLKLHYVVYPRILAPLGWFMKEANTRYNQAFRALFLKTINPSTPYEHFLAWNVTANTALFDFIETCFGFRSLYYLAFAGMLWYITGSYEIFFIMTSFVHYFR